MTKISNAKSSVWVSQAQVGRTAIGTSLNWHTRSHDAIEKKTKKKDEIPKILGKEREKNWKIFKGEGPVLLKRQKKQRTKISNATSSFGVSQAQASQVGHTAIGIRDPMMRQVPATLQLLSPHLKLSLLEKAVSWLDRRVIRESKKDIFFFSGSVWGSRALLRASTRSFFLYKEEKSAIVRSKSPRKKEKAFFNKKKIQSMLKQDVKSCLYRRPVSRFPSDVMHFVYLVGAAASELVINDRFGFCLPRSI